jgi:hypothetical protein
MSQFRFRFVTGSRLFACKQAAKRRKGKSASGDHMTLAADCADGADGPNNSTAAKYPNYAKVRAIRVIRAIRG